MLIVVCHYDFGVFITQQKLTNTQFLSIRPTAKVSTLKSVKHRFILLLVYNV